MSITLYQSTDTSAPTLTGSAGSLITLLDACLVNGYGSKAAAGWTKPYASTNKAAYKMGTGGTGGYLRVQDDAPGSGGAREARCTGYMAMTDIDSGGDDFPTSTQSSSRISLRKSSTVDTTARPWIILADPNRFYLFIDTGDNSGNYFGFFFGDIVSYRTGGDAYACAIIGKTSENSSSDSFQSLNSGISGSGQNGHYIARSHLLIGNSVNFGKFTDYAKANTSTMGAGGMSFPNQPDGGLYAARCEISHNVNSVNHLRGYLPWLRIPLHSRPLSHGNTITLTENATDHTLTTVNLTSSGQGLLITSDTGL